MGKIEELAAQLRNELKQGKFKIGDRFPSEYELAEIYRVNNKTANKASALLVADGFLRRGKRGEGTFVRQTEIFPEMNLGFIGRLNHPYYCSILDGFQSAAFDAGYLTCIIYPRPENLGQTIMKLNTSNIAGYVCNGFELIENLNKPVIFLEKKLGNLEFPDYVACNSSHGSRMVTEAVLKRGHRDIVVFAEMDSDQDRVDAVMEALREAGISRAAERLFRIARCDSAFHCARLVRKALRQFPHLTAVITVSDDIANRLIRNLEELNIDWEGKITITGFGNVRNISDRYPVVTIDQHPAVLGAEAMEALIRKIRTGVPQQILIEPELVNEQFIFPPVRNEFRLPES